VVARSEIIWLTRFVDLGVCHEPGLSPMMNFIWRIFMTSRFVIMSSLLMNFLLVDASKAQSVNFDADQKGFSNLRQAGELVTIEVTPKAKELRLKVVGNTGAKVKVDHLALEATYGFGRVKKRVTMTRENNEFVIKMEKEKPLDLQIRVMTEDQAEDFDFKLK
jgi:hypothetical protein